MLVLSRKPTESLVLTIGDREVEVQVVRINGPRVTLGIRAPAEIPISRPAAGNTDTQHRGQPR